MPLTKRKYKKRITNKKRKQPRNLTRKDKKKLKKLHDKHNRLMKKNEKKTIFGMDPEDPFIIALNHSS